MPPFGPYPLLLTYGIRRYAFGARSIADRLGKAGLPDGTIAETWEVSDHDDEPAVVLNGTFRGRLLRELVAAFPDEVVRPGWSGLHLPRVVKFLDASHRLPVQVHPDDAVARARYGAPNGKDEAWHVVWAAPGASVLVGVKPGVVVESGALRRTVVCRGERFVLERWGFAGPVTATPGEGGFATLTNLGDAVEVEHASGVATLARAASCLLPAALGEVRLRPRGAGDLVLCFEGEVD